MKLIFSNIHFENEISELNTQQDPLKVLFNKSYKNQPWNTFYHVNNYYVFGVNFI